MASIKFKNFIRPSFLKNLQTEVLRRFLAPYAYYLESRGLQATGTIDCDQLAGILATTDQDTPSSLIEALETCDAICSPETLDELIQIDLARTEPILPANCTHADAVILTWIHDPDRVEQIFHRAALEIDRSLYIYRASKPLLKNALSSGGVRRLETALRPCFESRLRGGSCRVTPYDRPNGCALVIRHGDPIQKAEAITDSGDSEPLIYRPECLDVAFYDQAHCEWRISGRGQWLQDAYTKAIARMLHGCDQLERSNCYSLEPLRKQGLSALDGQTDHVRHVRLAELRVRLSGASVHLTGRNLNEAIETLEQPLFQLGDFTLARLAFTLSHRQSELNVTIHQGKGSVRGDIDNPPVEDWLTNFGFLTTTTTTTAIA